LLVYKVWFKWMQSGLKLRQSGDLNNQHLEQDIRRHVENPQDLPKVQDTRWYQAKREDTKKRGQVHAFLHALDWSSVSPDKALDHAVWWLSAQGFVGPPD